METELKNLNVDDVVKVKKMQKQYQDLMDKKIASDKNTLEIQIKMVDLAQKIRGLCVECHCW